MSPEGRKAQPAAAPGTTRIPHQVIDALCRVKLTSYETRVLNAVFRKTYGWNKAEDWVSLSQFKEMTGLHDSHISRSVSLLEERNIITKRGKKISVNEMVSTWKDLPNGVRSHKKKLPDGVIKKVGEKVADRGNPALPHGADTRANLTRAKSFSKEKERKTEPAKEIDWERLRRDMFAAAERQEWADRPYIEKTWEQGSALSGERRANFARKVNLLVAWERVPKTVPRARLLFHEIAGFVNDQGAMRNKLSPQEIQARKEFREETGQSLDEA